MENSETLENIPQEFLCPITYCLMEHPVIARDGHTYEEAEILQWIDKDEESRSPITRESLYDDFYFPEILLFDNLALKSLISSSCKDVSQYCCPLTKKIMKHPITMSDGHTYEQRAITEWLYYHGTSPLTKNELSLIYAPNLLLKSLIDKFAPKNKDKQKFDCFNTFIDSIIKDETCYTAQEIREEFFNSNIDLMLDYGPKLISGESYFGLISEGALTGPGIYCFEDGSIYVGYFNKQSMEGVYFNINKNENKSELNHPDFKIPKIKGSFLNWRAEGKCVHFNCKGVIRYKGMFQDDKRNGHGEVFDESGALIIRSYFKDKLLNGNCEIFNQSGSVVFSGSYKDGNRDGFGIGYERNYTGKEKRESRFFDTLQNGPGVYTYNAGFTIGEMNYKEDFPDGFCKIYHKNGNIKYAGEFKRFQYDGQGMIYHSNGNIFYTGQFIKQCGQGKMYSSSGDLLPINEFTIIKGFGRGNCEHFLKIPELYLVI